MQQHTSLHTTQQGLPARKAAMTQAKQCHKIERPPRNCTRFGGRHTLHFRLSSRIARARCVPDRECPKLKPHIWLFFSLTRGVSSDWCRSQRRADKKGQRGENKQRRKQKTARHGRKQKQREGPWLLNPHIHTHSHTHTHTQRGDDQCVLG